MPAIYGHGTELCRRNERTARGAGPALQRNDATLQPADRRRAGPGGFCSPVVHRLKGMEASSKCRAHRFLPTPKTFCHRTVHPAVSGCDGNNQRGHETYRYRNGQDGGRFQ